MKRFLILVSFLFLIALSTAAPPITAVQTNTEGIEIAYPKYTYVQAGVGFELHYHIFNMSNGLQLDNTTADCLLHLYDEMGDHIYQEWANFSNNTHDFENYIGPTILTGSGQRAFILQCNASNIGGFASGTFYLSPNGEAPVSEGQALIIFMSFFVIILFTIGLFVMSQRVNKDVFKIIFMVMAIVMAVVTLFYSMVLIDDLVFDYTKVVSGYTTFFQVVLYSFVVALIGFMIFSILVAIRMYKFKRGWID